MKTGCKIAIGALGFLGALIAVLVYPISAIDGIWRSPFHINCMCSSYDFVEFRNGTMTYYSDKHESAVRIGEYASLEDGRFEITFDRDPAHEEGWIVRPRLFHWFAPIERSSTGSSPPGKNRLISRLFYRPLVTHRAEEIIASGPMPGPVF